jgi:hypothetical protein
MFQGIQTAKDEENIAENCCCLKLTPSTFSSKSNSKYLNRTLTPSMLRPQGLIIAPPFTRI